jgi:exodeoxyribonuclease-5
MLFGEEQMTRDWMRWLYTAITRATERVFFVNFDERFFE